MIDENALLRLKAKDPGALEEIMARYGGYVMTIIRSRTHGQLSIQDREEVAADVFLLLWKKGEVVQPGKLKAWLAAVARNKAMERLRQGGLPPVPLEEEALAWDQAPLWEGLVREERVQLITELLGALSREDREIFLRHYELCQSSGEIARAMGMNPSTVKVRLHRGREKMRQLLSQKGVSYEA